MKILKNGLFVFILLLNIISCKEDNDDYLNTPDFKQYLTIESDSTYTITATKNVPGIGSAFWKSNGSTIMENGKIDIYFINYSFAYFTTDSILVPRELISFQPHNLKIGDFSQLLTNAEGSNKDSTLISPLFVLLTDDGDVAIGSWQLDTTKKNTFKITGIDYERGIFAGTFNFYFYSKDPVEYPEHYSQRINFLNGKFTLPIPK
ncbi:MAG: hypothetical protein JNK41_10385 [Saprospiraceae bacterium]|jgi:hypothetical protein|nr:hypothetical protein [Saprospiraceae bacterium]